MSYKEKIHLLTTLGPHKPFFIAISRLASPHTLRKALAAANDSEIDALLLVLHACAAGVIPVPPMLLKRLIKSKKLPLIKQLFETEETFATFLQNSTRHQKLASLSQIKSLLPAFSRVLL